MVRYVQGVFDKNVKPTIGPAFWTKRLYVHTSSQFNFIIFLYETTGIYAKDLGVESVFRVLDKWKVTLQIWGT